MEVLAIRRCWQCGLTLSKTYRRLKTRYGYNNKEKLIKEWREMKRLFGCASLPHDYLHGYVAVPKEPPTQQELNAPVTLPAYGGNGTYGDWAGITGPGAKLRKMLKSE